MRSGLSISLRLTFWFSAIFLCGFVIFGALLLYSMTSSVNSFRDQKLKQRAEHLAELVQDTHPDVGNRSLAADDSIVSSSDGRTFEVYSLGGKTLKRDEFAKTQFPWPHVPSERTEWQKTVKFNGERYRVYVLTKPFHGARLRIFAARTLTDNPDLLDRSAWILIRFIPAMLLASALAGYFVSRRALMPIVQLTESARSITIGNLAARLPVSPVRDELARLAETCNEMLSRLEEAVKRITQFTADASHELRTPIALIRVATEDALRIPEMPAEAVQTLESIITETVHAQALLEDMLLLARFDASRASLAFDPIYPVEIAESVVTRMRWFAAQKDQTIKARFSDDELVCSGNAEMFFRLVRILVDNAIKYSPARGIIEVALVRVNQEARLTVSDNGPGIAEIHLLHIFDRFFRVDPSRAEQKGTGLGLAIAKRIADAHRAEIIVRSRQGFGTTFQVSFPVIDTAASSSEIPTPASSAAYSGHREA